MRISFRVNSETKSFDDAAGGDAAELVALGEAVEGTRGPVVDAEFVTGVAPALSVLGAVPATSEAGGTAGAGSRDPGEIPGPRMRPASTCRLISA